MRDRTALATDPRLLVAWLPRHGALSRPVRPPSLGGRRWP